MSFSTEVQALTTATTDLLMAVQDVKNQLDDSLPTAAAAQAAVNDALALIDTPPDSPVFTWSGSKLSLVTYSDGSSKAFTWDADQLDQVDFARPSMSTIRKMLSYNPDGTLSSVTQSEV